MRRLAIFIARLTSGHVPMGFPQFLHDTTVSLVGFCGVSSPPPHFAHLKALSEFRLVLLPRERLLSIR
jgi:hypothetical protein